MSNQSSQAAIECMSEHIKNEFRKIDVWINKLEDELSLVDLEKIHKFEQQIEELKNGGVR